MKKAYVKYIISMILFGLNGIVASNINLSSYEIVLFRTMIGSALLIILFLATKHRISVHKNTRDLIFIALSGISMGTSWMFLYESYSKIGVSLATLFYYIGPVIVMMLSPIIFKEKLTVVKIVGFIAVLVGILFVNGIGNVENINTWGVFCGFMSAVMYSFMVIFNKKSKNIIGFENPMIQLFISFLTVSVFVFFKTGFKINVSSSDLFWIAILGIINTGIGCYFYFSSIGKLPVQTVAIFGYLELLSAVLFAVILLGEVMMPLQIVGASLIVVGAIAGECYKSK